MNIVFDFGAVVFAWQPQVLVAQAFPKAADAPDKASALAQAMFGHPDWLGFDQGMLTMPEVIARSAKRLSLDPTDMAAMVERIADELVPIPGTLELLRQLQQQKATGNTRLGLYYLSNMSVPFARTLERKHGFLNWFDGGIFSGDVQLVKPEPGIYALLESRYALQAEKTIFIDDLLANVDAARARGWQGIHFQSPAQLQADLLPLLA